MVAGRLTDWLARASTRTAAGSSSRRQAGRKAGRQACSGVFYVVAAIHSKGRNYIELYTEFRMYWGAPKAAARKQQTAARSKEPGSRQQAAGRR